MKQRRRTRELREQSALVVWFYLQHPNEILIVSANGGNRGIIDAVNLKRSGVRPGVPDIFLPIVKSIAGGLWIEFKPTPIKGEPKPRASKEQLEMIDYLNSRGYIAKVCFGIENAMTVIESYMELE